ncbi:hypothetical protein [Pseudomonas typographi]|nr:hypothetical protein [Pseudomonas typographi]MBD1554379.1 hypothetical protein [Pseudomonas typographi]
MGPYDEVQRAETLELMHEYQALVTQQHVEPWIEPWAVGGDFPEERNA